MTKIYLVSAFSMEPYSDYGDGPVKAFKTKTEAERYIEAHDDVYDQGYYKWDETLEHNVSCDETDEDAFYEYGWKYSSYVAEIELVDE